MLIERKGKIYLTRRSLLRAGVAALAVGGSRAWAIPHGGGAIVADALSTWLADPTWSPNTWRPVTTQGGQSNSDYTPSCYINQTGASDYNATVAADIGSEACADMVGVYEGGAFDAHANRFIIGVGGAHHSAWSNELIQFDLASLKWTRLTTPDDAVPQTNTWTAIGSIPDTAAGVSTVMTLTSVTGWVAPNAVGGCATATNPPVPIFAIMGQLTNTDPTHFPNGGGPGTYTVLNNFYPISGITAGSTIVDAGFNSTWNGQYLSYYDSMIKAQCTNLSFSPGATHTYTGMKWVPNYPDVAGCVIVAAIQIPYKIFSMSALGGLPTKGLNWQSPSRPTDSTRGNLPQADCSNISPWKMAAGPNSQVFNGSPATPAFGNASQFNGCFCPLYGPPGQAKGVQFASNSSVEAALLYDFFADSGQGSNPFTVLSASQGYLPGQDPGSFPSRGPIASSGSVATEVWMVGAYPQPDAPYTGLAKWSLVTGARTNFSPTGSNLSALNAYTPYMLWHPGDGINGDRFVALGTQMVPGTAGAVTYTDPVLGSSLVRNTSSFGGVSPGNVFDIINPNLATPSISQIVSAGGGGTYSGYPANSMPPDMNFVANMTGDGQKFVYVPKYNCLALLTGNMAYSRVASVYIYKCSSTFPYS